MTQIETITMLADTVIARARAAGVMLAMAESCTGGLIAGALTEIPGSSDVLDRGFVTYSNDAKIEMLGVPAPTIAAFGAVSGETAASMAAGARDRSHAAYALSVTGIAGPGGGGAEKPVGLVWFGLSGPDGFSRTERHIFKDHTRAAIRASAVETGLGIIISALADATPS